MHLSPAGKRLRDERNEASDSALLMAGYVTLTALSGRLQELPGVHAEHDFTGELAATLLAPAEA